jgi:hypothetical protein
LVVNRGNGNGGHFRFEFCIIDPSMYDTPVVCENHTYKISGERINQLYDYFHVQEFKRYIDLITVNGMLTKNMILNFPIKIQHSPP